MLLVRRQRHEARENDREQQRRARGHHPRRGALVMGMGGGGPGGCHLRRPARATACPANGRAQPVRSPRQRQRRGHVEHPGEHQAAVWAGAGVRAAAGGALYCAMKRSAASILARVTLRWRRRSTNLWSLATSSPNVRSVRPWSAMNLPTFIRRASRVVMMGRTMGHICPLRKGILARFKSRRRRARLPLPR